jgi:hypothetical protein
MKITLIYNDFKKDINIDLFKKNGLIQETILNCCSLIIYNIEKTDIIFDNDDFYTIGSDNILFDDTFNNFLIKRLDYYKKLNINCEINESSEHYDKFVSRFTETKNKNNYKIYSICDNVYFDESVKNEIIDLPNYVESTKEHINLNQEISRGTALNIDTFAIPNVGGQCERLESSNDSSLKEDKNIFSEIDINLIDSFLKIRNIIIYDRKRDEAGNVIKDNYIIDRYTKWYQNYENENYINYIKNYNSNIIRFPFNSLLQNILTSPLNIDENEENENNENNEIKDDIESDTIDQNINNEIDLELSNNENIFNSIENSQEVNSLQSEVGDITNNNNLHNRDINNFINIFDNFIRNSNNNQILDNSYFNILNENVNIINILNQMNDENNDLPDLIPINEINNIYIPTNIYYTTAVDNNQYINEDIIIAIDDEEFNKNKSDKYDSFNLEENKCCECLICMEQFNNEDIVTEIKCKHIFHKKCIKEWLCKQSNKCPICRIEVGEGKPINI